MRLALVALALAGATGVSTLAQGPSAMAVSAVVENECRVSSGRMDFGAYNPVGSNATTPLDSEAVFEISCTPGTRASVALGPGGHVQGMQRRMMNVGREVLRYDFFRDAGRAQSWSPGDAMTLPVAGDRPIQVRVRGRVPAGQDVSAGRYEDTVLILVSF